MFDSNYPEWIILVIPCVIVDLVIYHLSRYYDCGKQEPVDKKAEVLKQGTHKPCVLGSSPTLATFYLIGVCPFLLSNWKIDR